MSLLGKAKKRLKKAAKKYGKTVVRASAAYMTGGASEMYYQKASGFLGGAKQRLKNPLQAAMPNYQNFGGGWGAPRVSSRGIVIGG